MNHVNRNKNEPQTQFRIGGVDQGGVTTALPAGYDYTKWHSLRVEKADSAFKIFVDGMLKQTRSYAMGGGKIGYTTQDAHADFGYAAFSNKVSGSNALDAYKPVTF
ncbi:MULTISPECIES: hypothetical protein [Paenibacillus]|uniref:hypothetical protein n=1 Tax=Paenibacillus TaxID=44249 RepID=UPI0022B8E538|nr:hypothetical protein [Paenibacillus caseinilyticus]MCZ8519591.1 hypothetical protein [Paenibacillus caseinilyticus]